MPTVASHICGSGFKLATRVAVWPGFHEYIYMLRLIYYVATVFVSVVYNLWLVAVSMTMGHSIVSTAAKYWIREDNAVCQSSWFAWRSKCVGHGRSHGVHCSAKYGIVCLKNNVVKPGRINKWYTTRPVNHPTGRSVCWSIIDNSILRTVCPGSTGPWVSLGGIVVRTQHILNTTLLAACYRWPQPLDWGQCYRHMWSHWAPRLELNEQLHHRHKRHIRWGKGVRITSVECQVTLCDPIWSREHIRGLLTYYKCLYKSTYTLLILTLHVLPRWTDWRQNLLKGGGTTAAAPPPFRPSDPALCGSRPLVTPY